MSFFQDNETNKIIKKIHGELTNYLDPSFFKDPKSPSIIKAIEEKNRYLEKNLFRSDTLVSVFVEVLSSMLKYPQQWDEKTTFNQSHIGDEYIRLASEFTLKNSQIDNFEMIVAYTYRFYVEYSFSHDSFLSPYFKTDFGDHINSIVSSFQPNPRREITFANGTMIIELIRFYTNNQNVKQILESKETIDAATKVISSWNEKLSEERKKVKNLLAELGNIETAYNFVGLSHGFQRLTDNRSKSKTKILICMILMGLLMLAPLCFELVISFNQNGNPTMSFLSIDSFFKLFPFLAIEIILLYFFRILLHNYESVKAQLLQLELRQTLCQFIQSYADYASGIKQKDSVSLEKFENLIFSGIVSEANKLPSTFDGLDQITKLAKEIKKS